MYTHIAAFCFGMAFGVLLYDTQTERRAAQPRSPHYCPRENAAGQSLAASMVSSAGGTPTFHECLYR